MVMDRYISRILKKNYASAPVTQSCCHISNILDQALSFPDQPLREKWSLRRMKGLIEKRVQEHHLGLIFKIPQQ